MKEKALETDRIAVGVSGAFTTHHRLETAEGVLGTITFPALRARATFQAADGGELEVQRTSWWRGEYELREHNRALATSHPRGFFRREIIIEFADEVYLLRQADFWSRRWHLTDGTGLSLLEIEARGVFRRGAYITVLGPLDADLLVFAYCLVQARWQEQTAAATAAAAN